MLLVDGGDAMYLCHWMRQSGLVDLLPSRDRDQGDRRHGRSRLPRGTGGTFPPSRCGQPRVSDAPAHPAIQATHEVRITAANAP